MQISCGTPRSLRKMLPHPQHLPKTNLECEVALRTHICERGVVPNDQDVYKRQFLKLRYTYRHITPKEKRIRVIRV